MGDSENVVGTDAKLESEFFYDRATLKRPLLQNELPRDKYALHHSFGFNSNKRNNMHYIEDDVLLYSSGNSVQLLGTIQL